MTVQTELKNFTLIAIDEGSGNAASAYADAKNKLHVTITPSSINRKQAFSVLGKSGQSSWKTEEGNPFTVVPYADDAVNTCDRDYQVSEANRVITHEVIRLQDFPEKHPIVVGVTLPAEQFYNMNDADNPIRDERIQKKKDNLNKGVVNMAGCVMPEVLSFRVFPEVIPAYFYCQAHMTDIEWQERHKTLVLDIGRFTNDMAIISSGYEVTQILTTENGVHKMLNKFRTLLVRNAKDLNLEGIEQVSDAQLDEFMRAGVINAVDVQKYVDEAAQYLLGLVMEDIHAIAPQQFDITRFLVVGGGAYFVRDILPDNIKARAVSPKEPEKAVVLGVQMLLEEERPYIEEEFKLTPPAKKTKDTDKPETEEVDNG